MTSDNPLPDRCGATCRDDNHCENYPIDGHDRCRMHLGTTPDGESHVGNQNATRHGLHADPANALDHLADRDGDGYEWVMKKYDSYLEDAPFQDGSAKADELKQICAQEYAIWKGIDVQLRGGLVVRDGDTMTLADLEENPVNRPLDRLQRSVTNRLKELGVLDDPDSQRAGATQDKAAALRELMNEADSE